MLSKSFGYSLRALLYVALMSDQNRRVQVDEIAKNLSVPRHYLGKIMNRLVKEGLLNSTKGPYGGFSVCKETLSVSLIKLVGITDGMSQFNTCLLRMDRCNADHPCPLHHSIEPNRVALLQILNKTTVEDLLNVDRKNLVKNITSIKI